MKPMLAHRFSSKTAYFPCFGQPKLNGVRGIWLNGQLISRGRPNENGIEWDPYVLPHIFSALNFLMSRSGQSFLLDGELYCHGLSLQQINSRVAVNRTHPHDKVHEVKYHIFDIPHHAPFSRRAGWLSNLAGLVESDPFLSNALSIVPTTYLNSSHEAEQFYKLQRADKFEGAMYRDPNAPYGFAARCSNKENRWKCLLKRKAELDLDATIIGMDKGTDGKGFADTMGSLILELDNGIKFNSGSGVQLAQRDLVAKCIDELVANKTRVRVLYDELSDAGVPLRNRIECIYDPRF